MTKADSCDFSAEHMKRFSCQKCAEQTKLSKAAVEKSCRKKVTRHYTSNKSHKLNAKLCHFARRAASLAAGVDYLLASPACQPCVPCLALNELGLSQRQRIAGIVCALADCEAPQHSVFMLNSRTGRQLSRVS